MPQQINLLTPILLAPKRYFSALAMLQATGLLLLAGLALAAALQQADRRAEREHQVLLAQYTQERQALLVAQAGLPAAADPAALEQQLRALQAGNAERAELLRAVSGVAAPGLRHSDLLALIARTLPENVWLTELGWSAGRLELAGGTLDTSSLRPWLSRLSLHPLLLGQELQALRVERLGATPTGAGGTVPLLAGTEQEALAKIKQPVWGFRVVSAQAVRVDGAASSPSVSPDAAPEGAPQ